MDNEVPNVWSLLFNKRFRAVSEAVTTSTPQQKQYMPKQRRYQNQCYHQSIVQFHRSYPIGTKEPSIRSNEFSVTGNQPGSVQNYSSRMETVRSSVNHSVGWNYSRSHTATRGHSLLSQTWKSGLQYLPATSFVSSLVSAYSIIERRPMEEGDLGEEKGEREEEQEDQVSRGSEEAEDEGRAILPMVMESGEQQQWSVYDNAYRTTPAWVSSWNVINLIQGVGVMAVPYACFQAGWLSLPIMILISVIACYTGHMIGECLYDNPRLAITGYRELHRTRVRSTLSCIASQVIPRFGGHFTGAVVLMDMFGAAVLYLLLLGKSSSKVLGPMLHVNWPLSYWILLGGCLQIPVILCRGMRIIAWFSMIAMTSLHSCILTGILYCAQEVRENSLQGMYLPPPDVQNLPIAISIIVFSYTAHAALPGIEGSMKQPGYFPKMLNVSFSLASVVKLTFGLFCAIVIGTRIKDSVAECMGNRPVLAFTMNSFLTVSVFFSNPLFFHILGEQMDSAVAPHVRKGFLGNRPLMSIYTSWFISTRCALLALAVLIAVLVPYFATIIGFLGAITGSLLAFILPSIFHLILFWSHLGCSSRLCRISIAIFGITVGILGLIAASCQATNSSF